jgi:hypothetical protein
MIGALAKKTGGAQKRKVKSGVAAKKVKMRMKAKGAKKRKIAGPGGALQKWSKSNRKKKRGLVSGAVARATAAKRGSKLKRTKGKAGVAAVAKAVREKRSKLKGPNALRQKPTPKRRGGLGSVAAKVAGAKRKPARRKARRGAVRRLF